jgi:hypothetical protein
MNFRWWDQHVDPPMVLVQLGVTLRHLLPTWLYRSNSSSPKLRWCASSCRRSSRSLNSSSTIPVGRILMASPEYPSSTHLLLCIQSTSSRTLECFRFHPWNSSPAEWRCTPDRRHLYQMLWGKPPAEWCSSAKFGSHVSLFPVPIFCVNICPFNYRIKGDFISELTINTQCPQDKSVQHPFFPPLNRCSLRLDPNPNSLIF